MKDLQQTIDTLLEDYHTNDPKELCEAMNIPVFHSNLGNNIAGFTQTFDDEVAIHINSNTDIDVNFTIAHELYHALYHREYSTYFLKRTGFNVVDKLEREANEFATLLLASQFDSSEYECITTSDVIRECGIPEEFSYYLDKKHLIKIGDMR